MALTEVLRDLISSMIQSILNGFLLMLEFFKEIWNMQCWVLKEKYTVYEKHVKIGGWRQIAIVFHP